MKTSLQRVLPCALIALVLALAPAARAQLSSADWQTSGDHQLMDDSGTNLQWLGLDETAGMSFNQVSAQLGTGGEFEGFSFATPSEVETMFADAGIPNVNAGFEGTAGNLPGVTLVLDLWNADIAGTFEPTSGPFGYFVTSDVGTGLVWIPMGSYGDTGTAEATSGPDRLSIGGNADFSVSYMGSALVRNATSNSVPDGGTTMALLGGAFAGLAMLRRRFSK
jgi:hypothetical protein